ncbi:hypothetical protein [Arenimonas oryziterrae]|uniref:Glycine zipper domain-containing protein n=1 Tax=Arenimonas oryziterrae DSM 21050 = YC6267 TaxID=1121015 RepID=A0A091BH38_9GAMM|nr:hypothetical protein [Arenimonas oryziterrae]KFN43680.1 hypothetical protein N789_10410 [Arenimonas oryziterrae DSM 21050 = YC6267]
MSDIKKEHVIGTGTGAVAGAVAGAAVGVLAGPIGMAAGAVVGSMLGAGAGNSLAEVVNPTVYADYWRENYLAKPYYQAGREWSDYQPAYDLGYSSYASSQGRKFDDIEAELQRNWESTRGTSKLAWVDARGAVHDGWTYVENGKSAVL